MKVRKELFKRHNYNCTSNVLQYRGLGRCAEGEKRFMTASWGGEEMLPPTHTHTRKPQQNLIYETKYVILSK